MVSINSRPSIAGVVPVAVAMLGLLGSPPASGADSGPAAVDQRPTGRILLGIGATTFGGLSGNFVEACGGPQPNPTGPRTSQPFNQTVVRLYSMELLTRHAFSGIGSLAPGAVVDWYDAPQSDRFAPGRPYVDRAVRVEDIDDRPCGFMLMPAPRP